MLVTHSITLFAIHTVYLWVTVGSSWHALKRREKIVKVFIKRSNWPKIKPSNHKYRRPKKKPVTTPMEISWLETCHCSSHLQNYATPNTTTTSGILISQHRSRKKLACLINSITGCKPKYLWCSIWPNKTGRNSKKKSFLQKPKKKTFWIHSLWGEQGQHYRWGA